MLCKNVFPKIKNNHGESLAETLVSVLVIAVGLLLLSSLIMASTRMVDRGNERMETIYAGSAALEKGTAAPKTGYITVRYGGASILQAQINVNLYQDESSSLASYSLKGDSQ